MLKVKSRPSSSRLSIVPLTGALGAELFGVDLSTQLDDDMIAEVRGALLEHGVIFFRDQKMDAEQQIALAKRFAPIFVNPNFIGTRPDPEISDFVREPGDTIVIGEDWHTDTTMMPEPPMGAILYSVESPEYAADTIWANQYLAYDALSDGMKKMLSGLRAYHSDHRQAGARNQERNKLRRVKFRADDDWQMTKTAHPVVRVHPETGRKCLFVSEVYCTSFEGMTEAESKPLMQYLFAHCVRPEFQCRFRWRTGSVAFWDNRCTQHLAVNDRIPSRRVMRRVQLAGGPVN